MTLFVGELNPNPISKDGRIHSLDIIRRCLTLKNKTERIWGEEGDKSEKEGLGTGRRTSKKRRLYLKIVHPVKKCPKKDVLVEQDRSTRTRGSRKESKEVK